MPFPAALPAEVAADPWRLRLLSDADWMLAWTMSRDPDVVRWTLYPPEMTEDAAQRRSRRITEVANQRLSGHYAVLDADHVAIGTAGISSSEGDPTDAEVFYALLPAGRHRGAATAATRALSQWAFSVGVERVLLLTIPGNTASEAVARRAAFLPDGEEFRDHRGSRTRMRRWARTAQTRTACRDTRYMEPTAIAVPGFPITGLVTPDNDRLPVSDPLASLRWPATPAAAPVL